MIFPTIHLNGTGRQALVDQLCDACTAINAAVSAMGEASPNGRDYYPQGPDALPQALREHQDRIARLIAVREELMEIAEKIMD